jgi:hypothetical protein
LLDFYLLIASFFFGVFYTQVPPEWVTRWVEDGAFAASVRVLSLRNNQLRQLPPGTTPSLFFLCLSLSFFFLFFAFVLCSRVTEARGNRARE